jgi:plasmid stability protein
MISSRYHQEDRRVAQVVIRNIDEDAMRRLKSRAARKGVSLERELRTILTEAARADRTGFGERASAFRRKLADRRHSDSTRLIRKDRDR